MSDEERNTPPPDDNENPDDVAPKTEDPNAPINVKVSVLAAPGCIIGDNIIWHICCR